MIRYITILLLFNLIYFQGEAQSIENVDFRIEGESILINYDLKGEIPFQVRLFYSLGAADKWQSVPTEVCKGAIGTNVNSGSNFQIIWQPLLHLNNLEGILYIKLIAEYKDNLPEMVLVRGGTFNMGSNESEDEQPIHLVSVKDFYLSKYEITVADFQKFILATAYQTDAEKKGGSYIWGENKWEKKENINWHFDATGVLRSTKEQNHPVIHISWNDAVAYCAWLGKKTGNSYRLPTEAEWEYAAGNGTNHNKYSWGDYSPNGLKGGNVSDESAKKQFITWTIFSGYNDGYVYTSPVGSYESNIFGLYDMTGNVWEWCEDGYDATYYKNSSSNNPVNKKPGSLRVLRGGGWNFSPRYSRVTYRGNSSFEYSGSNIGFRVVSISPK